MPSGAERTTPSARLAAAGPVTRGLLWTSAAGLAFSLLNTLARALTQQGDVPTGNAIVGGLVTAVATLWVARREGRERRGARPSTGSSV